jgi:hypothetical protein
MRMSPIPVNVGVWERMGCRREPSLDKAQAGPAVYRAA